MLLASDCPQGGWSVFEVDCMLMENQGGKGFLDLNQITLFSIYHIHYTSEMASDNL